MDGLTHTTTLIEIKPGVSAAMHRFVAGSKGIPVLLIHGSIENARIFYTKKGKGLAPFLANRGFDVFVPDMAGKGHSVPKVSRTFRYSQTDTLEYEIPAYIAYLEKMYPHDEIRLAAHSWGGVLLLSWYAQNGEGYRVGPMVFFGSKRRISVFSAKRFIMLDIMWMLVGMISSAVLGYLPAKALKMGSENEPAALYRDVTRWVYTLNWRDKATGFNYVKALKSMNLPPILYYAGINDHVLGHPADVAKLMNEAGSENAQFILLGKHYGNLHDYGHVDILTAKTCNEDHFIQAAQWLHNGCLA
jgi:predicted alpha/beta hydrolase